MRKSATVYRGCRVTMERLISAHVSAAVLEDLAQDRDPLKDHDDSTQFVLRVSNLKAAVSTLPTHIINWGLRRDGEIYRRFCGKSVPAFSLFRPTWIQGSGSTPEPFLLLAKSGALPIAGGGGGWGAGY